MTENPKHLGNERHDKLIANLLEKFLGQVGARVKDNNIEYLAGIITPGEKGEGVSTQLGFSGMMVEDIIKEVKDSTLSTLIKEKNHVGAYGILHNDQGVWGLVGQRSVIRS